MDNVVRYTVTGQADLARAIERMTGPELRRVSRTVTRDAMAPILAEAQQEAPVLSGRIRASLGELSSSRKNSASAKVGTRRDFTYEDASGKALVHGRLKGKKAARAYQAGAGKDVKTAQQYASPIHFGVDSKGRVRRKAGPSMFLEGPMSRNTTNLVDRVADAFRRHIEST